MTLFNRTTVLLLALSLGGFALACGGDAADATTAGDGGDRGGGGTRAGGGSGTGPGGGAPAGSGGGMPGAGGSAGMGSTYTPGHPGNGEKCENTGADNFMCPANPPQTGACAPKD